MKHFRLSFFIALFILVQCISVEAVKKEFKFEKIDFGYRAVSAQKSTVRGLGKGKLTALGRSQKWGVIEVAYESLPRWVDDVELRYYVLLKAKKKKKQIMLAGSITYIHVANGKHHSSNIYIPPQVLRRYGEVLRIRAEIWYNGVLQDNVQWPRRKKASRIPWWTRIKPTYGSLMNRFYTPFEHETQLKEEVIKIQ